VRLQPARPREVCDTLPQAGEFTFIAMQEIAGTAGRPTVGHDELETH